MFNNILNFFGKLARIVKNKQIFTYELFFLIHPIVLHIFVIIVYLLLYTCLADISLCDNGSKILNELMAKLALYSSEYKKLDDEYETYSNLLKEFYTRPERHESIENYLMVKKRTIAVETMCSLNKIRITETYISELKPDFITNITKSYSDYY
jgi:hypothetical protein